MKAIYIVLKKTWQKSYYDEYKKGDTSTVSIYIDSNVVQNMESLVNECQREDSLLQVEKIVFKEVFPNKPLRVIVPKDGDMLQQSTEGILDIVIRIIQSTGASKIPPYDKLRLGIGKKPKKEGTDEGEKEKTQ